ncbi:sugar ABC transporter permease [Oscillospiraceae bacterium HV4-5-C5C]|nr:sugar ABC transporter permease [Oscillospiraceae bacterium HV4-5-C5C]
MIEVRERGWRGVIRKYGLLMPAIILILVFFVGPILLTIYYSFTNLALTGSGAQQVRFVGWKNYQQMFKDPNVYVAILNTLIFLFGSLIGQQLLGFTIAYCMKSVKKWFRSLIGPIILAIWVMPEVVSALCMYSFFYDDGTVNQILSVIGIPPVLWLYQHAMLTVVLANIFRGTAFSMMMFQSALDEVPGDLEEAAAIDGAGRFTALVRIVLPCIRRTIGTNTILNTLQTLGVFGMIFMMTGGGPGTDTQTLPIFMYNQAFKGYNLAYGTAISMILLFLGAVLSVFFTMMSKER